MSRSTAVLRFFRTPKGLLLLLFVILLIPAAAGTGVRLVAPAIIASIAAACAIDVFLLRYFRRKWEFPSGAILTGLIVAMVLSPHESWGIPACTSALAIVSKYLFRTRYANVFNPAALALVITFYIFDTGQSWWGALPEISPLALSILFATGIFIADRVNRLPMVLVFLGSYYLLFTIMAFGGNAREVAEIFRAPDLHASLYFAFFILTDPPTSPNRYRDQVIYALIVGVVGFAMFELIGAAYYLLAGVLAGNLWEGWRRWRLGISRQNAGVMASTSL